MELFAELDIDNFNEEAILESITEAFSKPKVYISFKYTKKRKVIFYHLQVKVAKTTKDLLQGTAVKDSDGSQTFFIGEFSKNTEIEIKFGIIGFTTVPKAVALIAQTNPEIGYQVDPKTPGETKSIDRDEKWEGKFKYKVQ
ncbi:MAG: hypothetical protein CBB72_004830 [Muricauda sp. TMED12]|nr:MAG: hypothetical protein CBB72_004830 [Muricauda sp. TMED12]|tara:strand:+ start:390 stop:812 length:423 start_codon:yes stop_codon:yes gene_type:complete